MAKTRENPETCKVGLKWSEEENAALMKRAAAGMPLKDIATAHARTVGGVKSHIMLIALMMVDSGSMTLEEVGRYVHISVDELEYFKEKQAKKSANQPINTSNSQQLNLIHKIHI